MKHHSKFSPQTRHTEKERTEATHQVQHQAQREFASAEELLRFDSAQTAVPPQIEERLKQSSGQLPPPPRRAWWQQLLGQ